LIGDYLMNLQSVPVLLMVFLRVTNNYNSCGISFAFSLASHLAFYFGWTF